MRSAFVVSFLAPSVFFVGASVSRAQEKPAANSEKLQAERARGQGGPVMRRAEPFPEAKQIPAPKNETDLATATEKLATELNASGLFSGAILLAADGKPLVQKAWGLADRDKNVPNMVQTSFDIGSVGKLVTQIAILQLADAGKLSLDQPFGKYLSNYPNVEVARKVTPRQLLLHMSGMGDFADAATRDARALTLHELKDFLPLFAQKPLDFAPGSQTEYSNAGYIVLGLIIEAVSGENYYNYVEKHVLKPAQMMHSGFFDRDKLPPSVARSYDEAADVTKRHPVRGSSAGGLQASVGDLFRLVQAIDAGKVVSKGSVTALRDLVPRPPSAPLPPDPSKFAGYGIAGGGPGVNAQLHIDPTGRYVRIVLCNGSPPMASSMAATIGEWIKQLPK